MGRGKAPRGTRGRGRRKIKSPTPSEDPSSDESNVPITVEAPPQHPEPEPEDPGEDSSSSPHAPKKRAKKTTDLTSEEEEDMVEWIKEHEVLYNKKLQTYHEKDKKGQLWEEKAKEMNRSREVLEIWYRSMRTRYGKLRKKRSGDGAAELTEREEWILAHFDFLKRHIYEVQKRTVVSIKAKAAAAAAPHDEPDIEEADPPTAADDPPATADDAPISDVTPRKKKTAMEEDSILAGINERGQQSIAIQQKMLELLQPAVHTERTAYAEWTKSVMEDLDLSLWRRFQVEHSQLLYRYLDKNDDIRISQKSTSAVSQQQPQGSHGPLQQPAEGYYHCPSTSTWQPAPQYWPSTLPQTNTSVWGSQSAEWVQNVMQPPNQRVMRPQQPPQAPQVPQPPQTPQLTTLQPVNRPSSRSVTHQTPSASTSTPADSDSSFNLSNFISDSDNITPLSTSFVDKMVDSK